MTVTNNETELFENLDFEPPCGWNDCPVAAVYFVQTKCCQTENLLCQEHLEGVVREWYIYIAFHNACAHCGESLPETIEEWLKISPLKS